jgi:hypothetical protein
MSDSKSDISYIIPNMSRDIKHIILLSTNVKSKTTAEQEIMCTGLNTINATV